MAPLPMTFSSVGVPRSLYSRSQTTAWRYTAVATSAQGPILVAFSGRIYTVKGYIQLTIARPGVSNLLYLFVAVMYTIRHAEPIVLKCRPKSDGQ